jgi:hypothetical protein
MTCCICIKEGTGCHERNMPERILLPILVIVALALDGAQQTPPAPPGAANDQTRKPSPAAEPVRTNQENLWDFLVKEKKRSKKPGPVRGVTAELETSCTANRMTWSGPSCFGSVSTPTSSAPRLVSFTRFGRRGSGSHPEIRWSPGKDPEESVRITVTFPFRAAPVRAAWVWSAIARYVEGAIEVAASPPFSPDWRSARVLVELWPAAQAESTRVYLSSELLIPGAEVEDPAGDFTVQFSSQIGPFRLGAPGEGSVWLRIAAPGNGQDAFLLFPSQ